MQSIDLRRRELQAKRVKLQFIVQTEPIARSWSSETTFQDFLIRWNAKNTPKVGEKIELIGSVNEDSQLYSDSKIVLTVQSLRMLPHSEDSVSLWNLHLPLRFQELQDMLRRRFDAALGLEQGEFLYSLVFGGTAKLPNQLVSDMRTVGLSHVVAASGYNVSLLINFSLTCFTQLFRRRTALYVTIFVILLYALYVGMTPPVVRSVIMGAGILLALASGRGYQAGRWLFFSALLMLCLSPMLLFSVSFTLSFLATYAILRIFPLVSDRGSEEPQGIAGKLRALMGSTFLATLCVQICCLPYSTYTFGSFSLVSLLSNPVLVWVVEPLTVIGVLFLPIFVLFPQVVSSILLVPIWVLVELFIQLVHLFARLPFALLSVSPPSVFAVILSYILLFLGVEWALALRRSKR